MAKKARELTIDEALNLILTHAAELRPFTSYDWLEWAGAGENPRIYEGVDYIILMSLAPDGVAMQIEIWDNNGETGDEHTAQFSFQKAD